MVANYGGPMRLFEAEADGRTVLDRASEAGVALTTGGRALVSGPIISSRTDIFANNEGYAAGGRRLETEAETAVRPTEVEEEATRASAAAASSSSLGPASSPGRSLSHTPATGGVDRSNYMFVNLGDGTFRDDAAAVGLRDESNTGRGTALFDANGDGLIDIVYGNWNAQHRLFLQQRDEAGGVSFTDAAPADMAEPSRVRTVIVADFDNDGYEEIFYNNIPGENCLFKTKPYPDPYPNPNPSASPYPSPNPSPSPSRLPTLALENPNPNPHQVRTASSVSYPPTPTGPRSTSATRSRRRATARAALSATSMETED